LGKLGAVVSRSMAWQMSVWLPRKASYAMITQRLPLPFSVSHQVTPRRRAPSSACRNPLISGRRRNWSSYHRHLWVSIRRLMIPKSSVVIPSDLDATTLTARSLQPPGLLASPLHHIEEIMGLMKRSIENPCSLKIRDRRYISG
jgi:hypothetical protein